MLSLPILQKKDNISIILQYKSHMLTVYNPVRPFQSSSVDLLTVPRIRSKCTEADFSYCGCVHLNKLPADLRSIISIKTSRKTKQKTQNLFIRPDLCVNFHFESNRSPGAVEWGWQSCSAEPFAVQGYHDGLMRKKRWFREEAREHPGPLSVGTPPLTALLSAHILNTSVCTTLFFKSSCELHE